MDGTAASWVQNGALLVFASAVLWELRQQRNERNSQAKALQSVLSEVHAAMSILLDRAGLRRRAVTKPEGVEVDEAPER